jgi:hypothetical protein
MSRPQQPYDDQYGQHDSYYPDDQNQGHPQGHAQGQYDQGYGQQGDGYYEEQYGYSYFLLTPLNAYFLFTETIIMPVNKVHTGNKAMVTITMVVEAMRMIIMVITTMVISAKRSSFFSLVRKLTFTRSSPCCRPAAPIWSSRRI